MDDIDETAGVPVHFDSDEEDDRMVTELKEDKSEDEDVGVEAIYEGTLRTAEGSGGGKADGIGEVFFNFFLILELLALVWFLCPMMRLCA